MSLNKEINLNKNFILIFVLVVVITLGLSVTYAYFQIGIIKNNIVVLRTANIDINTAISGYENPSFTLNKGETKNITVNLTTQLDNEIGYKMYYDVINGSSMFKVTSTTSFTNNIVEGSMNGSKTISFAFQNIGEEAITLSLGTQGGLLNYGIPLDEKNELVLDRVLATSGMLIKDAILAFIDNTNSIVEDGITYVSGNSDSIDFNYVWYSGKLWRITAINSDGTLKMITDDGITNISYDSIYSWLNEDFLDTLYNYQNLIATGSNWNIATSNSINTQLPESQSTMITGSVGLLNSYEYYQSYRKASNSSDSYLNISYDWWILNRYDSSSIWYINHDNVASYCNSLDSFSVRPSVILKSNVVISDGIGSKQKPYILNGDREKAVANTSLINTRSSGEYLIFNNELYRIVSIHDGITKINKNDYVRDATSIVTRQFSTSGSGATTLWGSTPDNQFNGNDYWDYYLNFTWYNNLNLTAKTMLTQNQYYIKYFENNPSNYKGAICKVVNTTTNDCEKVDEKWEGYVGLLHYGEMFATQQGTGVDSSVNMWLITPYNESYLWYIGSYNGIINNDNWPNPTNTYAARPTLNLKSNVKIIGGNGTKEKPYLLG